MMLHCTKDMYYGLYNIEIGGVTITNLNREQLLQMRDELETIVELRWPEE